MEHVDADKVSLPPTEERGWSFTLVPRDIHAPGCRPIGSQSRTCDCGALEVWIADVTDQPVQQRRTRGRR